jgi:hypothetical protein
VFLFRAVIWEKESECISYAHSQRKGRHAVITAAAAKPRAESLLMPIIGRGENEDRKAYKTICVAPTDRKERRSICHPCQRHTCIASLHASMTSHESHQ